MVQVKAVSPRALKKAELRAKKTGEKQVVAHDHVLGEDRVFTMRSWNAMQLWNSLRYETVAVVEP